MDLDSGSSRLPFLQGPELRRSAAYFHGLFEDAFAYVATTPSYFGGSMPYGWATDNKKLRTHTIKKIERRYKKAGSFATRYWRPDKQTAAFALSVCIRAMVEPEGF